MKVRHSLPFVLLLGTIFGSSLVVSRFSVGQYDPRTYIALRLTIAAVLHLVAYLFTARRLPRGRSLWIHAAVLGIIGSAMPMTAVISSLQYQSSGVTSLLMTLNPVVTLILAQIFLQDESMTWGKSFGVMVAFSGAILLFVQGETGLAGFTQADWRGYMWSGAGVVASASGSIYARRFLRHGDSFDVASIRMFSASLVMVAVAWSTVGFDLSRVDIRGVGALVYASVLGTFVAFLLSFYIIKRFGATASSQTSYVMPVASTVLGSLLLGEQVTANMLAGMALIFSGLALLNWRDVQRMVQAQWRMRASANRG
ncbi:MAG: DMT family transporter [Caldilineaceae bacterium]|nr:DMT family transporter [Caldilineaceae bacterium]